MSINPVRTKNQYLGVGTLAILASVATLLMCHYLPTLEVLNQHHLSLLTSAALFGGGLGFIAHKFNNKTFNWTLVALFAIAIIGAFFARFSGLQPMPSEALPIALGLAGGLTFAWLAKNGHLFKSKRGWRALLRIIPDVFASLFSQHERALTPTDINNYRHYLQTKYTNFYMLQNYMSIVPDNSVPKEKTLISVPVVIEGAIEDHIVHIRIDLTKKTLFFYDSKGLHIEDYDSNALVYHPKKNLRSVVEELRGKFTFETVEQSTTKQQYDSHNCGFYVLADAENFAKPNTFPENATPAEMRRRMGPILDAQSLQASVDGVVALDDDCSFNVSPLSSPRRHSF